MPRIGAMKSQTFPAEGSRAVALLDGVERLSVLALYCWLIGRMVSNSLTGGITASLFLLPSEGLVVIFMLIRRQANDLSGHPREWLFAFLATCTPLLVSPGVDRPLVPVPLAATLLVMGLLVQLHAKITLGRSFGCIPANRGLKLSGPYRFVRHPIYAGYLLSHAAFLAMNPTLWNLIVYSCCYSVQIPRLLAEERLLSRDLRYREYQQVVRYRLVPGVF